MRIAITGASGLIGKGLVERLRNEGHEVATLVRGRAPGPSEIRWDPTAGEIDSQSLEGLDALFHLSGENIAGRFTDSHKRAVTESRVSSTGLIARTLAKLARKPKALICASAIGYYGDRGDEPLDESSPPGTGFLPDVCVAWEAAAEPARQAGLRVCHVRVGVVLSTKGGALKELLTPFKLGVGGRLGSGKQFMSWIDYDDIVGAFGHCLVTDELRGPVNGTGPAPVSNAEFTKVLGRVLHRPTLFPLPAAVIRTLFGEMGQVLLLEGARVAPTALEKSGYRFRFSTLEAALRHQLS
jgi:uncharacterized protein (TIGR01777 family)